MWTYCANFSHSARAGVEIKGPIFVTGLYEGYVRIPWLGDRAPRTDCPVKCFDCGDHVENGIEEFKTAQRDRLASLCRDAGIAKADLLADTLSLLLEGAPHWANSMSISFARSGPTSGKQPSERKSPRADHFSLVACARPQEAEGPPVGAPRHRRERRALDLRRPRKWMAETMRLWTICGWTQASKIRPRTGTRPDSGTDAKRTVPSILDFAALGRGMRSERSGLDAILTHAVQRRLAEDSK
jgi:hypothetical protein